VGEGPSFEGVEATKWMTAVDDMGWKKKCGSSTTLKHLQQ